MKGTASNVMHTHQCSLTVGSTHKPIMHHVHCAFNPLIYCWILHLRYCSQLQSLMFPIQLILSCSCIAIVHAEYIEEQSLLMRTRVCFSHLIRAAPLSATFTCLPWDQSGQKWMTNLQRSLSLHNANDINDFLPCLSVPVTHGRPTGVTRQ